MNPGRTFGISGVRVRWLRSELLEEELSGLMQ
jgi:hypothetical protein